MDTSKELKPNRPLNVISFCSGYGGIERGLDLVGVNHRVLAYVEIEAYAITNLVNKMESGELDAAPIYSDLKTFPSHLFRDCVDLITGGYPCQPFSGAGRRKGEDDPRHLWPYIREHVNTIRPTQCFFENVEGHISLGLSSVLSDMEEDGYDSTWGIFSAAEVGAPHQRKRVFILANAIGHTDSDDGEELAYSFGKRLQRSKRIRIDRSEVVGREEGKHGTTTQRSNDVEAQFMAHTDSDDGRNGSRALSQEGRSWMEYGGGSKRQSVGQPEEKLAYPDSSRFKQSNEEVEGRPSEQPNGHSLQPTTTHSDIEGLQGRVQGGVTDSQGREEQKVRCTAQRGDRWSWDRHSIWTFEPDVGRVVDGCSDRVDRIRMLGNGVVPQQSAKAWEVLNELR